MKTYIILVLLSFLLFSAATNAQQLLSTSSNEDVQSVQAGILPSSTTMLRGGQEKTASGTLKVLVIFVRYLDDTQNTSTWPDYNVLPAWAQSFVNPNIPANNIYTPLNLSDFFDRASGGNGNGSLGQFHVIGDVVYVTTKYNQLHYNTDTDVFMEILQTLDDPAGPYNINFKQYDNWQFMRGDTLFNHYYKPGVGDGIVDQIWIINRGASRSGVGAEKTLQYTNYPTNDGVTITSTSGSRIFLGERDVTTPDVVKGPAHEYCHYLFGGDQETGHFDGRVYNNYGNEGRINMYALMCAVNAGFMSCYEQYRLGWLNPTVITSNTNSLVLNDSHLNNQAIIIPLRYDPTTGWLKEYYFLENYETRNEYAGANPFVQGSIFNHTLTHGILAYHVKNEDFNIATNSSISIVNADGRYSWKLVQGASTPNDRSDDLIGKDIPTYHSGYDYRDCLTINVGGVNYIDYVCLIHHNTTDPDGWRYSSDDFLGTDKDFFNTEFNNVFTRYGNPAAYLGDDVTATNAGFQVLNFNPSIKAFTLSVQVDNNGVLSLAPSKPQNFRRIANVDNHPQVTWELNTEPDINGYYIYRSYDNSPFSVIWSVDASTNTFVDNEVIFSKPIWEKEVKYYVVAVDNTDKRSCPSDQVSLTGELQILPKNNSNDFTNSKGAIIDNGLSSNFPNPFNPSTIIKYSLQERGRITLIVYDIMGKEVARLVDELQTEGEHSVNFDGSSLASGMYIYQLKGSNFNISKKMLLLK